MPLHTCEEGTMKDGLCSSLKENSRVCCEGWGWSHIHTVCCLSCLSLGMPCSHLLQPFFWFWKDGGESIALVTFFTPPSYTVCLPFVLPAVRYARCVPAHVTTGTVPPGCWWTNVTWLVCCRVSGCCPFYAFAALNRCLLRPACLRACATDRHACACLQFCHAACSAGLTTDVHRTPLPLLDCAFVRLVQEIAAAAIPVL